MQDTLRFIHVAATPYKIQPQIALVWGAKSIVYLAYLISIYAFFSGQYRRFWPVKIMEEHLNREDQ